MKFKAVDYIVFFLVFIVFIFILTVGINTTFNGKDLNEHEEKMIQAVIISVLSIIGIYVGSKIKQK